jgi:signal transduction histidine kinase
VVSTSDLEKFMQFLNNLSTRDFIEALSETIREPCVILDGNLRVQWANRSFYQTFRLSPEETANKIIYDLGDGQWDITNLRTLMEEMLSKKTPIHDFRIDHDFLDAGRKVLSINAFSVLNDSGVTKLILLTIEGITDGVGSEEQGESLLEQVREGVDELAEAKEDIRIEVEEHIEDEQVQLEVHEELGKSESKRILGILAAKEVIKDEIIERQRTEEALQESGKQVRYLSSRLLEAQEHERKLVAQELHDSVGAGLTAIIYGLEELLEEERLNESQQLRNLVSMARDTMEEARRISSDLRPSILDDLGLLAAMRSFYRRFRGLYSDIQIEEDFGVDESEIPEQLKIVIYRVFQEALNNVAKHSEAEHVRVSVSKTEGTLQLYIEDNGKGFNVEQLLSDESQAVSDSMGIASMQERTEISDGSFVINSDQGRGTTIRASWPIRE